MSTSLPPVAVSDHFLALMYPKKFAWRDGPGVPADIQWTPSAVSGDGPARFVDGQRLRDHWEKMSPSAQYGALALRAPGVVAKQAIGSVPTALVISAGAVGVAALATTYAAVSGVFTAAVLGADALNAVGARLVGGGRDRG
jgi:hypothetical protein